MSVSAILNAQGKVPPQYIDFNAPPFTGYITNPLTSDLLANNRAIIEASYVSADEVKTDKLSLVPGSGATYLTVDENLRVNGEIDIQRAVTSSNPTLKLTNTDTSISASLDYDSFSVNLRAPDVPIFLQYLNGLGTSTNSLVVGANTIDVNISDGVTGSVCKFGNGSITIESDFGAVGSPVLALTDTGSGNSANIDFGINTLNIGTNTGDIAIYAPAGNITVTANADFSVTSATVKLPTLPSGSTANQLFYDTSTKDVTYGPAFPAITVQAATGTIALTEAMNRSTYILTGVSATQTFTSAGLAGVAAGWCVYLRNGNNATGLAQDITISIPAGSVTLHTITGTTNSAYVLLYWDGSALVAYR
jgi:hypothetical protein